MNNIQNINKVLYPFKIIKVSNGIDYYLNPLKVYNDIGDKPDEDKLEYFCDLKIDLQSISKSFKIFNKLEKEFEATIKSLKHWIGLIKIEQKQVSDCSFLNKNFFLLDNCRWLPELTPILLTPFISVEDHLTKIPSFWIAMVNKICKDKHRWTLLAFILKELIYQWDVWDGLRPTRNFAKLWHQYLHIEKPYNYFSIPFWDEFYWNKFLLDTERISKEEFDNFNDINEDISNGMKNTQLYSKYDDSSLEIFYYWDNLFRQLPSWKIGSMKVEEISEQENEKVVSFIKQDFEVIKEQNEGVELSVKWIKSRLFEEKDRIDAAIEAYEDEYIDRLKRRVREKITFLQTEKNKIDEKELEDIFNKILKKNKSDFSTDSGQYGIKTLKKIQQIIFNKPEFHNNKYLSEKFMRLINKYFNKNTKKRWFEDYLKIVFTGNNAQDSNIYSNMINQHPILADYQKRDFKNLHQKFLDE